MLAVELDKFWVGQVGGGLELGGYLGGLADSLALTQQAMAACSSTCSPSCAPPPGSQWSEEVPDSLEERERPHRGVASEQRGMEFATCGGACTSP